MNIEQAAQYLLVTHTLASQTSTILAYFKTGERSWPLSDQELFLLLETILASDDLVPNAEVLATSMRAARMLAARR